MVELFAQVNRAGGPGAAQQAGALFPAGIFLCVYGTFFLAYFVIKILFLLSVAKCFQQITPRNRQMEPGMVWLNLIPLFDLVWMILTMLRLSDSLRDEYQDRRLQGDDDFGKTFGIITYVLFLVCGPVGWICAIIYWSKISGYTQELMTHAEGDGWEDRPRRRRDDDGVDDEDDRPRRRRRRDDDNF
jgi:hypothetical protein